MLGVQFTLAVALLCRACMLVTGEGNGPTLEPRQAASQLNSTFYKQTQNVSFQNQYGGNFTVALDAKALCPDLAIPNYRNNKATTLGNMLRYLENSSENITGFVVDALNASLKHGNDIWSTCIAGDYDGIPIYNNDEDGFTTSLLPGDNRTSIVAGVVATNPTSSLGPDAKLNATKIAAGLLSPLLYTVSTALDWIKTQERLAPVDAAVLKIFAEWSRSALRQVDAANISRICVSTGGRYTPFEYSNYTREFEIQDNILYQGFHLLSGSQVRAAQMKMGDCTK